MYYPKTIVANDFSSLPFLGQGICYDGEETSPYEWLPIHDAHGGDAYDSERDFSVCPCAV